MSPCKPERPRTLVAPGVAGAVAALRWPGGGTLVRPGEAVAAPLPAPVASEVLAALADVAHTERSLPRSE